MFYIVNFWVYAVVLKLLPCLVLTVISVCLVRTLCRAKSRRRALQGDVKKGAEPKAFPICRWRKNEEVILPTAAPAKAVTPPAPPLELRREKPLDDGGVWMGREETTAKEEEEKAQVEEDVEEEAATLVPEPSSRFEDDGAVGVSVERVVAGRREWWPSWLSMRRNRKAPDDAGCVPASQQQTDAVATVGAAVRRRRRRTERTTRMLVAVLILFLVTEFPQGVLGLMSGLLGRCFFQTCYHIFGDLMDLLALLNGSINFILYCAMSRQFRQTFAQLFCKHPKIIWTSVCKNCPVGQNNRMELMKNGNMGGEGLRKGATTVGGQPSQSMGEVQSTYV
ncbi:uncharacterized protein [Hetaerina americana]|uniref:uncharacterized protein n=1 Tax=Hetaerina americana TaxID=62018 RepID=UPI003A7F141F